MDADKHYQFIQLSTNLIKLWEFIKNVKLYYPLEIVLQSAVKTLKTAEKKPS